MTSRAKMAALDLENVEKKFRGIGNTQESIQSLSLWVIHHKAQHEKIVEVWFSVLKKCKMQHRLTLFYLCNDIVQTCRRKHAVIYKDAFKDVLKDAVLLVRDMSIRSNIDRIFTIWEERKIYDKDFIEELLAILNNTKVRATMNSKLLAEFKPEELVDKIKKFKRLESEVESKKRQVSIMRLDVSNLEAVGQLKDRSHGKEFCESFEESCTRLEELVENLQEENKDRTSLIEMLEQSEIFYDSQYGEAKIVANAYKNFGTRVSNLRKRLDEHINTLPDPDSPVPSPPIMDAPSPDSTATPPGEPEGIAGGAMDMEMSDEEEEAANPAASRRENTFTVESYSLPIASVTQIEMKTSKKRYLLDGDNTPKSLDSFSLEENTLVTAEKEEAYNPFESTPSEVSLPGLSDTPTNVLNLAADPRQTSGLSHSTKSWNSSHGITNQNSQSNLVQLTVGDGGGTPVKDEGSSTPVQDEQPDDPVTDVTTNPIEFLTQLLNQSQKTGQGDTSSGQNFLQNLSLLGSQGNPPYNPEAGFYGSGGGAEESSEPYSGEHGSHIPGLDGEPGEQSHGAQRPYDPLMPSEGYDPTQEEGEEKPPAWSEWSSTSGSGNQTSPTPTAEPPGFPPRSHDDDHGYQPPGATELDHQGYHPPPPTPDRPSYQPPTPTLSEQPGYQPPPPRPPPSEPATPQGFDPPPSQPYQPTPPPFPLGQPPPPPPPESFFPPRPPVPPNFMPPTPPVCTPGSFPQQPPPSTPPVNQQSGWGPPPPQNNQLFPGPGKPPPPGGTPLTLYSPSAPPYPPQTPPALGSAGGRRDSYTPNLDPHMPKGNLRRNLMEISTTDPEYDAGMDQEGSDGDCIPIIGGYGNKSGGLRQARPPSQPPTPHSDNPAHAGPFFSGSKSSMAESDDRREFIDKLKRKSFGNLASATPPKGILKSSSRNQRTLTAIPSLPESGLSSGDERESDSAFVGNNGDSAEPKILEDGEIDAQPEADDFTEQIEMDDVEGDMNIEERNSGPPAVKSLLDMDVSPEDDETKARHWGLPAGPPHHGNRPRGPRGDHFRWREPFRPDFQRRDRFGSPHYAKRPPRPPGPRQFHGRGFFPRF